MSRAAALLACWIAIGLERGFASVFLIELGSLRIAPSVAAPVFVFLALQASRASAVWVCVLTGAALDLTWSPGTATGAGVMLGPYAIGHLLGAAFLLKARGSVDKKNPLTLIVMSVAFMIIVQTFVSLVMGLRSVYDTIEWSMATEWTSRMASAGATGFLALAWWIVLRPVTPLMGFQQPLARFSSSRSY
ncbi:MAG: hypothetical protein AAF108_09355 [Planctomycetota bacterium]